MYTVGTDESTRRRFVFCLQIDMPVLKARHSTALEHCSRKSKKYIGAELYPFEAIVQRHAASDTKPGSSVTGRMKGLVQENGRRLNIFP